MCAPLRVAVSMDFNGSVLHYFPPQAHTRNPLLRGSLRPTSPHRSDRDVYGVERNGLVFCRGFSHPRCGGCPNGGSEGSRRAAGRIFSLWGCVCSAMMVDLRLARGEPRCFLRTATIFIPSAATFPGLRAWFPLGSSTGMSYREILIKRRNRIVGRIVKLCGG